MMQYKPNNKLYKCATLNYAWPWTSKSLFPVIGNIDKYMTRQLDKEEFYICHTQQEILRVGDITVNSDGTFVVFENVDEPRHFYYDQLAKALCDKTEAEYYEEVESLQNDIYLAKYLEKNRFPSSTDEKPTFKGFTVQDIRNYKLKYKTFDDERLIRFLENNGYFNAEGRVTKFKDIKFANRVRRYRESAYSG